MQIIAAVTPRKSAPFELQALELDDLRPDEVRVKMVASGVCHTDANVREQVLPTPLPAVLGHEGAGIVTAVGSGVRHIRTGDHVLLSANSCGVCKQCLTGDAAYCEELFARNFGGSRPDGSTSLTSGAEPISSHFFGQSSFSSVANVSARSVVVIDKGVDLAIVAPLGCGIQTGAGTVMNELGVEPGATLAIFGAGAVGFGALLAAVVAGCSEIIAVDINPARLELAMELGATATINSREESVAARIREITGGRGIDYGIDTTGRPDVLRIAADSLAVRGTVALVGASQAGTEVPFEIGESLIKGWTFKTVIQGGSVAQTFIPTLIRLWQDGRFPFDRLIKHYRLDEINQAIEDSERGVTIKPVVKFDSLPTVLPAPTATSTSPASSKGATMSVSDADVFTAGVAAHLIAGERIEEGTVATSHNPATDEALGEYADAPESIAIAAVAAAKATFSDTDWRRNRHARATALWDLAGAFEQNFDRLARAITIENGKPLGEAQFEMSLVAPKLRYYASLALADLGTAAATATGDVAMVLHEPIGVAGIIVPWNSPVILAVRSFAPALAAGCTAAIKMPAQTALTNALIAEVIASVPSLPAGVINMFTESGDSGSRYLVESPDVRVISYTGSTGVGAKIAAAAGAHLKRVSLELGGKTPMIVFPDANLDVVVPTLTAGVTTFAGQFCMTGSRILAHRSIADELSTRLAASLGSVKLGPGIDPDTQLGPMISHDSVARLQATIAAEQADPILAGGPVDGAAGSFYRPAILGVQDLSSRLIQDELFGPVATFETFESEEEAVERANATQYGLAASIWTADGGRSLRVSHGLDAGTVWTNAWAQVLDQFEEGGYKSSGVGRLNGPGGLAEFQERKHVFRSTL